MTSTEPSHPQGSLHPQADAPPSWWYCPETGDLVRDRIETRLEPRVARVFEALISRPGRVLARDQLFDLVWGDRVVVDAALTRCVAAIRAALRDHPPHHYIETLPKRGYRFLGAIEDCESNASCVLPGRAPETCPSVAPCLFLIPGRRTRSSPSGVIR